MPGDEPKEGMQMAMEWSHSFWEKECFEARVENAMRNVNIRQSMIMEKSWVIMTHQTDKEHEE